MPWMYIDIDFPDLGVFQPDTEESTYWIERMLEANRNISSYLNASMYDCVVNVSVSELFNGCSLEAYSFKRIHDDGGDVKAKVQQLFDEDKDLKRVFVENDDYKCIEDRNSGLCFYDKNIDVYVRGDENQYFIGIFGENRCFPSLCNGRPCSILRALLFKNYSRVDEAKHREILGESVSYNMAFLAEHVFSKDKCKYEYYDID